MANRFIIHEKTTNTYCSSTKHRLFGDDLNSAALFTDRGNAEKAIKDILRFLTKAVNPYGGNSWAVTKGDTTTVYHTFLQEYIDLLATNCATRIRLLERGIEWMPELEVLEVKLTVVS